MSSAPIEPAESRRIAWCPQEGPQEALVTCPAEDIFFGGARGGGKTDGELGEFALHALDYGSRARGVLFRRHLDELEEVETRAHEIYGYDGLGGEFEIQKRRWTLPGGATIRFRSLENEADARKHQGRAYTRVYFDELGNFESQKPFDLLWGSLRSRYGVPCKRISSGNPGGPGHVWVKARYIDPGPWKLIRRAPLAEYPELTIQQCFIPSLLENNRLLREGDPGYEVRLAAVGGAKLFKAWRMGDWDALEGQYFDSFSPARNLRTTEAIAVPPWARRWMAMDWGYEHHASIGFFAQHERSFRLLRSITVSHHDVPALARLIVTSAHLAEETGELYKAFYLSPDAFATESDSQTIAGRLWRELKAYGFPRPRPATTDRVNGWRATSDMLRAGTLLLSAADCPELIPLFASAVHDPDHPEDMLKFDGDDPLDMLRYGVMSALREGVKPREERLKEAVSNVIVDGVTGEVTRELPADPNVLAMRVRRMGGRMADDTAPVRPARRGF